MEKIKVTVLVVEDHTDTAKMLKEFLRHAGLQTMIAQTAAIAKIGVELFHPDVVVLDLSLPGFREACEFSRSLQKDGRKPFVLALNGWALPSYAAEAVASGCDFVLPKPFDLNHLLSVVKLAISMRRLPPAA